MFTAVVTSLVSDILLPPLSIIFPLNKNLDEKFAVLQRGPNYDLAGGYNTLQQAQADGAVVMAYGCVCLLYVSSSSLTMVSLATFSTRSSTSLP